VYALRKKIEANNISQNSFWLMNLYYNEKFQTLVAFQTLFFLTVYLGSKTFRLGLPASLDFVPEVVERLGFCGGATSAFLFALKTP